MPDLKLYSLFVSHAWKYNDEYYRLESLLNAAPYFKWRNYSVPTHDPLVDPNTEVGKRKLTELLKEQIRHAGSVIILLGMYASHSEWIQKEISLANSLGKPVIGVIPWGQQRVPSEISNQAVTVVGWNTDSVVSAIRRYSL